MRKIIEEKVKCVIIRGVLHPLGGEMWKEKEKKRE